MQLGFVQSTAAHPFPQGPSGTDSVTALLRSIEGKKRRAGNNGWQEAMYVPFQYPMRLGVKAQIFYLLAIKSQRQLR